MTLGQVEIEGLDRKILVRGHEYDCGRIISTGDFASHCEAVEARHGHIEQEEVG